MENNFNANGYRHSKQHRALGIGILTGGLLMAALGSAASHSWLGLSVMTIGILSIGVLLGYDIGHKAGRKQATEAMI